MTVHVPAPSQKQSTKQALPLPELAHHTAEITLPPCQISTAASLRYLEQTILASFQRTIFPRMPT